MKALILAFLAAPLLVQAQFTLSVVDGTNETPLLANSVFQLQPMETGDRQAVRLRVRNTSAQSATITRFSADGSGFSLNRPLPPIPVAPGGVVNAELSFSANMAANYSANLQLNGLSILVVVTVSAGPVLGIESACQSSTANLIEFGIVIRGGQRRCGLTLQNAGSSVLAISTISISGSGFTLTGIGTLLTLEPGQSVPFVIEAAPQTTGVLSGSLRIQNRLYSLHAIGAVPPLPAPVFEFEPSPAASGQQRRVSLRMEQPSPVTTSGLLTLTFAPDSILAADDPAILFLESASRQVRFAVQEGSTAVTLHGLPSVTFQTGTTAGRIRLTLSGVAGGLAGETEATVILAPVPVAIDRALPARFPERLELTLSGFDNTFSAGSMVFRFYDATGQPVTILADFTAAFRTFYDSTPGGSTFQIRVSFPVSGNHASIVGIEADLVNTAGTVRTGRLNF